MIKIKVKGDFNKTLNFLRNLRMEKLINTLEELGQEGVDALAAATPVDTGATAASWGYTIFRKKDSIGIIWTNSNVNKGVNIALLLQYGHGTGTGGYVEGRDYINPAIRPIFDKIAESAWKEMTVDEQID